MAARSSHIAFLARFFLRVLLRAWRDFIRLVYLHATKETKNYLDAIDPVDEEAGHEADAAGGRRDRDFLVQRSRFLAALKTRLGLILAKAVAMCVMINATGCPAPVLDRNRMNTQAPFPTDRIGDRSRHSHTRALPVWRGGRSLYYTIALRLSLSSVPLGLPLWASLSAFFRF